MLATKSWGCGDRRTFTLLSTLNPAQLQPSDYLDLSGIQASEQVAVSKPSNIVRLQYGTRKTGEDVSRLPFPPNTKGFLYYHRPPPVYHVTDNHGKGREIRVPVHPAAGQLRFRLVDIPDPTQFASGHDLRSLKGLIWGPNIFTIHSSSKSYRHILPLLYSSFPDILPERVRSVLEEGQGALLGRLSHRTMRIMDNVLEPFEVDFSRKVHLAYLLAPDGIKKVEIYSFGRTTNLSRGLTGFGGRAICRFEPVTSTSPRHGQGLRIGIRILSWLTPPSPDFPLKHEVGGFMKRWRRGEDGVVAAKVGMYIPGALLTPGSMEVLLQAFPEPEVVPKEEYHYSPISSSR